MRGGVGKGRVRVSARRVLVGDWGRAGGRRFGEAANAVSRMQWWGPGARKKTILMDLVAGGTSAIPNPGKLTLNNAKRQRAFYNTFISTYSLTSGTPQKPNGCGNTDLFVIVTVRLTDSNTVQKPKSMSCTLNSISDDVTVALTAKGTGRVWR